ncbi:hypothetical protein ABIC45_002200 [Mucilaginibacter rubeus]|uniref:hypothetical protein n=1 Tax=Mucilaginibacter TaxID=423349 RepID=UPI00159D4723|nr:hypothetical protein [Mucilaginibacter sp. SG538B]
MNERKWTLTVILLIALGIGIYNLINCINKRSMQTVSFKNCTENYYYSTQWPGMEGDEDHAAKGRLARCLCQSYLQKPDTAISRKIMEIYNSDGRRILFNTSHNKNYNKLDSIIKYRKMAFDTLALYD